MSRQLTENETKVSKLIENVLKSEIATKPEVQTYCQSVKLEPFTQESYKGPKILIVEVDARVMPYLRIHYKEYLRAMNKDFEGNMIVTVRNNEVKPRKGFSPDRAREEYLQDLCFPAMIKGRSYEVEDRENGTQIVYLDSKQGFWNETSISALKKLVSYKLKDTFEFAMFAE